jgi:hypothetical protein
LLDVPTKDRTGKDATRPGKLFIRLRRPHKQSGKDASPSSRSAGQIFGKPLGRLPARQRGAARPRIGMSIRALRTGSALTWDITWPSSRCRQYARPELLVHPQPALTTSSLTTSSTRYLPWKALRLQANYGNYPHQTRIGSGSVNPRRYGQSRMRWGYPAARVAEWLSPRKQILSRGRSIVTPRRGDGTEYVPLQPLKPRQTVYRYEPPAVTRVGWPEDLPSIKCPSGVGDVSENYLKTP